MLSRLQKIDKDTNDIINMIRDYLFSIGIRTSKERAWAIFQTVHQMPYKLMVERNKKITYQGQGKHITHKYGNQLLVVKNIGKFELKGVSVRKDKAKRAVIKFMPSAEIKTLVENSIEVVQDA